MTEKLKSDFQDWYKKSVVESNDFSNPEPILKYAAHIALFGKDSLPLLRQIEQDLINRKYIDAKIERWEDFLKHKSQYTFASTIQYYIASVIKIYKE